jgi:hypothetical protein
MIRWTGLLSTLSLLWLAGSLAGCNGVGAGSFASDGSAATLITTAGLFTLDSTGAEPRFLTADINAHYAALFVNGGQDVVYVSKGLFLFKQPAVGGKNTLLRQEKMSLASGFVLRLPNNQLLILDERRSGERVAQVIDPNTAQIVSQVEGIAAIFVSSTVVQPRADGSSWRSVPAQTEPLYFIFQAKDAPEYLYLYTADTTGFSATAELPRKLSAADRALLASHDPTDLNGAVLSANGKQLLFRTKGDSAAGLYGLWLMDLESDLPVQSLLAGMPEPPQFALSPSTQVVAYQSANGVVQLRDLKTGKTTTLPKGSTLAGWQ